MCLGIAGKVLAVTCGRELLIGKVDFGGMCRSVCLEHVPETKPGEYALVDVGYARARIDAAEAKRVFALLGGSDEFEQPERSPE